jgi:hypothetical protein
VGVCTTNADRRLIMQLLVSMLGAGSSQIPCTKYEAAAWPPVICLSGGSGRTHHAPGKREVRQVLLPWAWLTPMHQVGNHSACAILACHT